MHYNWNRFYDPNTGRYITQDPIKLTGGNNFYLYTRSNPVNEIDSEGLRFRVPPSGQTKPFPVIPIPTPGPTSPSNPFIDALPRSGSSSNDSKECEKCDDPKYRDYIKCYKLYGYPFPSKFSAFNSYKSMFGYHIRLSNEDKARDGPCSIHSGYIVGKHWNVLDGSSRVGSIAMCECCEDTNDGAKVKSKFRGF